jgi:uncharacterized protein YggU (UPF0235/DUF167 family)
MRIFVKAKPGKKENKIIKLSENIFEVWVKEKAREGKANEAIAKLLADYFHILRSRLKMISGEKNKQKIFEIS